MSTPHIAVQHPIFAPITMVLVTSVSSHPSRNPFLTAVDTIITSSNETINFERCYWSIDGNYAGILGSTETTGGLYNREFHIHPKLGLYARDCLLAVRVRREDTGPWSETHIALDPSAPEMVHELFAALLGHVPNASMGMRFSVIARLLLNGRHEDEGFGFAHPINEARARLG